jgi:RNA recognition motif-containing protein
MVNIFVGSLSSEVSEEELRQEFEIFGKVSSVKIIMDRETRKPRGFAFVEMPNREEALAAIGSLNGKDLHGQSIKVNEAKPKEARVGQSLERGGLRSGYPDRGGSSFDQKTTDIYDSKEQRSGGHGKRGRGGRGFGGRSGGGGRSH